jgi:hypothetical protein
VLEGAAPASVGRVAAPDQRTAGHGSHLGQILDRPAMTLGSPLVRFAASPLHPSGQGRKRMQGLLRVPRRALSRVSSLAADRRPGSSSQQTRGASARPSTPLPARCARFRCFTLRRPGRERAGASLAAHDEARRRRNRRGIPAGSGTRRRSSACAGVSSNPRSDEDLCETHQRTP